MDDELHKLADRNHKLFSSLVIFLLESALDRRKFLDRARFEQVMVDFMRCSNNLIKLGRNMNLIARLIQGESDFEHVKQYAGLVELLEALEVEVSVLSGFVRRVSEEIQLAGKVENV